MIQRKYVTSDGKTYDQFFLARQHELQLNEDSLGQLLDNEFNNIPTNTIDKKMFFHNFLTSNSEQLEHLLHNYNITVNSDQDDFE